MSVPTRGSDRSGPLYSPGNEDDYTTSRNRMWDNWGRDTHSFSSNSSREDFSSSEKVKSVHKKSSKNSAPRDPKVKSQRKVTIDESFNQEFDFEGPVGCCPCGRKVKKKFKEYFKKGSKFLGNTYPGKCGKKLGQKMRPKLDEIRKKYGEFVNRRIACLDRKLEKAKQTGLVKTLRKAGGKVSSGIKLGLDKMGATADRIGKSKIGEIVQDGSRHLKKKMKTWHAKVKGIRREETVSANNKFQNGLALCLKKFNQLKEKCRNAEPFEKGEKSSVKEESRRSWERFKKTIRSIKNRVRELCTKCRSRFGKNNEPLSGLDKLSTDGWSGDPNKKGDDTKFPDGLQEDAEGLAGDFLRIDPD